MKIKLATQNQHKVEEFRSFDPKSLTFESADKTLEIDEIYDSFLENAYLKAKTYAREFQEIFLADDSGLIVPILGGEPGVLSARYSQDFVDENSNNFDEIPNRDRLNNLKLLTKLQGKSDRRAFFVCVLVLVAPTMPNLPIVAQGIVSGNIKNILPKNLPPHKGFGYDMLFEPEGYEISFAEMTRDMKNSISHRGIALRNLEQMLNSKNLLLNF